MTTAFTSSLGIGLACCAVSGAAQAQLGDFLGKIVTPILRPSDAASGAKFDADSTRALPKSTAMANGSQTAAPLKGINPEVPPDRFCNRPQEKFNVMEKVAEYGGAEASARFDRLITSDFQYSDLKPEDRAMLKYLAQTTVWVPPEVESGLGTAFDLAKAVTGTVTEEGLGEAEEETRKKVDERLQVLKSTVSDFPTSIKLSIDPTLADGAFAKFGGLIVLSKPFMEMMQASPLGGDLVLAHELSHIYKRHAIKRLQYEMLSTREGWTLAQKVLGRAAKGANSNFITDAVFTVTVTPQLVEMVRSKQLGFTREQELEADACAIVWMRAAGVAPAPAWDEFVTTFVSSGDKQTTGYGQTHPPTAERAENYKIKIAGNAPAPGSQRQKAAPALSQK